MGMPHSTPLSPLIVSDDDVASHARDPRPDSSASVAQGVIGEALALVSDESLRPQTRLIGAQALLDDLARALARMALDLQPEGSPDLSEPDR